MTYRGKVKNGRILLDEPAQLPEGARVNVEVIEERDNGKPPSGRPRPRSFQPIDMPGGSLADELVRDRR